MPSGRVASFFSLKIQTASAFALLLVAPSLVARSLYLLTNSNGLTTVDDSAPGSPGSALSVSGLGSGDALVAIDVRPQNNRLYGLGYNAGTATVQLYLVEIRAGTAIATAIGSAGSFVDAGNLPLPITGMAFDIDFNPTVDRLRIVTNSGMSFRMNPNTGALVDGDLGGSPGSVPGLNPDGSANGAGTAFDAVAYTNNRANVTVTTLYALDAGSDSLFIVNPPNAGTLTAPKPLTLNAMPLDVSAETGFDMADIDVAVSNTAGTGEAYAALSVAGVSGLYRIALATGATRFIGGLGALAVRDIAVAALPSSAQSLSSSGMSLQRFLVQSPGTTTTVNITGVAAGERLVGLDVRPATGQWIALGVNPLNDTATAYRLDPQSGAATAVGASNGMIQFVDGLGAVADLPDGTYGVSFNPVVDRIRVVASNGINFRVNPITGGPVDGDFGGPSGSIMGINPDGPITINASAAGLNGAAYTNNFAGTSATTLYTLDSVGDRMFIQNPPNNGIQTLPLILTLNAAVADFAATTGFDIPPGPAVGVSNLPASGFGYTALTIAGATKLYRLSLNNGVLEDFGAIGTGATPSAGLTIGDIYDDVIFADDFEL